MRLAKINLIRKGDSTPGTPKQVTPRLFSTDRKPIGAFWYIKEELDDSEARRIAKVKQVDGYRGNIFYGSAEKLWKKNSLHEKLGETNNDNQNKPFQVLPDGFIGRSYGLLSDEEGDDEHGIDSADHIDHQLSSQHSYISSITQQDPLSPPLSPIITQMNTHEPTPRDIDQHTPPMPGSFVFEDEPPASPAFSSSLAESLQNIPDFLFSTPSRPSYVNPGLVLEHRYDAASPLAQHTRFDMTPRQLAAFSRRKQEFERLMERPSTPSALSDAETDDWNTSEKERAERERRRKDLQRFRLERQKRLRLENRCDDRIGTGEARKRPRDILEQMDGELQSEPNVSKRSKSSEIFSRALDIERPREPHAEVFVSEVRGITADNNQIHISGSNLDTQKPPVTIASPKPDEQPMDSYGAPTPSPSPPLQVDGYISKHPQLHVPKVPSGLRKAINVSSSPAASPLKHSYKPDIYRQQNSTKENEDHTRAAVDSVPMASYKTFGFPPLMSSFVTQVNPTLVRELSRYFQATHT